LSSRLEGLRLSWPESVPRDGQRTESLVVIVADRPQELRALEQRGVRSAGLGSELQRLLAQIGGGGIRALPPEGAADRSVDVRYAVHQITFLLDPNPAPVREKTTFLLDERPDISLLYRAARSSGRARSQIAIRLTDLIVHRNRILFGSRFRG